MKLSNHVSPGKCLNTRRTNAVKHLYVNETPRSTRCLVKSYDVRMLQDTRGQMLQHFRDLLFLLVFGKCLSTRGTNAVKHSRTIATQLSRTSAVRTRGAQVNNATKHSRTNAAKHLCVMSFCGTDAPGIRETDAHDICETNAQNICETNAQSIRGTHAHGKRSQMAVRSLV